MADVLEHIARKMLDYRYNAVLDNSMKVLPGQEYGSLYTICVWTEFRRKEPEKRMMVLCWCRYFLTYGIVEASNLLKGTTTSGKRFSYKKIPDGVLVDSDLEDFVRQYSWRDSNGYMRNDTVGSMHNLIYTSVTGLDIPEDMLVDHINRHPRDNRVINLRLSTRRQNGLNCGKGFLRGLFSSSQYKGVYFAKKANKWCSTFWDGQSLHHIGLFENEEQAHMARLKYVDEHIAPEDKPFL
jgi:HNH endonuclease